MCLSCLRERTPEQMRRDASYKCGFRPVCRDCAREADEGRQHGPDRGREGQAIKAKWKRLARLEEKARLLRAELEGTCV